MEKISILKQKSDLDSNPILENTESSVSDENIASLPIQDSQSDAQINEVSLTENIENTQEPVTEITTPIIKIKGDSLINEKVKETNTQEPVTIAEEPITITEEQVIKAEEEEINKSNTIFWNKFFTLKKDVEPVQLKKEDDSSKTIFVEEKPVSELFANYDSEFHTNEKVIMQWIRKFKMTASKTSIWFVLGLILITVLTVLVMMKIDPENQSIENYKANIISIFWKKEESKVLPPPVESLPVIPPIDNPMWDPTLEPVNEPISEPSIPLDSASIQETVVVPPVSTPAQEPVVPPASTLTQESVVPPANTSVTPDVNTWVTVNPNENQMITEKWLSVNPEVVVQADWTTLYIYKWKSYTKEQLQEELKKEVQVEINQKTKDYLNKVYINN